VLCIVFESGGGMCGIPVDLDGASSPDRTKAECNVEGRPAGCPPTDKRTRQDHRIPTSLHSQLHYRFHSSLSRHREKKNPRLTPRHKPYIILKDFTDSKMGDGNTKIIIHVFVSCSVVYKHNIGTYCKCIIYFKTQ
jgi:hypothetical protein